MDPRIPIQRHEFIDAFALVSDKNMFAIIPEIVGGFANEHLNVDADEDFIYGSKSLGLSEINMEALKMFGGKNMGVSPEETETIKEYFDDEIRG